MSLWTLPMTLGVCLWATLTITRPSKRFWLTLITYIEVGAANTMRLFHFIEFEREIYNCFQ